MDEFTVVGQNRVGSIEIPPWGSVVLRPTSQYLCVRHGLCNIN